MTLNTGAGANTITAGLYAGANITTINGNGSADAITLTASFKPVLLNGLGGNDTFTLGSNQTVSGIYGGSVSIDGGDGSDTIIANDTLSGSYTLSDVVTNPATGTGTINKNSDGGEGEDPESFLFASYTNVETRTLSG